MITTNDIAALMEQYKQEGGDMQAVLDTAQLLASTGKTSLGLNQWVKSDKPMMEDFNEDNRVIDSELCRLDSELSRVASSKVEVEKGNWTPVVIDGAATMHTPQVSAYSKIGSTVTLYFRADMTVTDRSSTRQLRFGGLPYPYDFVEDISIYGFGIFRAGAASLGTPVIAVNAGDIISFGFDDAAGGTAFSGATWGPATQSIRFVISYDTNQ